MLFVISYGILVAYYITTWKRSVHFLMGKFSDKWDVFFFFFSMLYGSLGGSSTAKT